MEPEVVENRSADQDGFTNGSEEGAPKAPNLEVLNMRIVMLQNLASRNFSRSAEIQLTKNKRDCGFGAAKTLDYLRRLIQDSINAELCAVIERYVGTFFDPAVANIRRNGEDVTDEHISCLCQQMLEEAKKMYVLRNTSAVDYSVAGSPMTDTEMYNTQRQRILVNKHIPSELRRQFPKEPQQLTDSDADSDVSVPSAPSRPRKRPKDFVDFYNARPPSRSSTPGASTSRLPDLSLADIPKWNPARINPETKFVLGSKANKALGMGAQRGRIYAKHTGLFKYVGDNDDKAWLHKQGIKSMRCGGRAFFIVMEDILELADTPPYRKNPEVNIKDLHAFELPGFIREKVKARMGSVFEIQKHRLRMEESPQQTGALILEEEQSATESLEFTE